MIYQESKMDSGCTSTTEVNDHHRQYCCSDDTATTMTSKQQQQHHSKQLSSGTATVDGTSNTNTTTITLTSPKSSKSYTAVRKNSSARSITNANAATTSKQSAVSRPELCDETGGTVTDDDTAIMSQSTTLAAAKKLSKSSSKKLSKSSKLPATPKEAKAKTKRTSSRKPFISRMREFFQLGKRNSKSDKKSSENSDDGNAAGAAASGDSGKKTLSMLPFQSGVAAATAHNAKKGAHKHTRTVGNLEQQMANDYGSDSDNEANDCIDKSKTVVSPMVSPMALIASARATMHPTMQEHDEEQKRLSSFESIATGTHISAYVL
jgi:hypothetical protein